MGRKKAGVASDIPIAATARFDASIRFDTFTTTSPQVRLLIEFVSRMPRASLVFVLVALVCVAGCSAYAGILVIESIAHFLGISRFVAGLLLGVLFLRLPSFRGRKLRSKGLLPARVRLPVMLALLAVCLADYGARGEIVRAVFIGLAIGILLAMRAMRALVASRVSTFLTKHQRPTGAAPTSGSAKAVDSDVIDVDFREAKK